MKRFVVVFISFWILYFAMIASVRVLWVQTAPLRLERNFINEDIHTVVLGPSNGQLSWNDSIIPHSRNVCTGGSSYGVSYNTLKWVAEYNQHQVDTVILCVSLISLYVYQDGGTNLWEEHKSVLDYKSYFDFYKYKWSFWETALMSFPIWLFNERKLCDGYLYRDGVKLDNPKAFDYLNGIIEVSNTNKSGINEQWIREHCHHQIENIRRIKDYCNERGKTLIVLNPPAYKCYNKVDDKGFRKYICSELGDSALVSDYSKFDFPDSTFYYDFEHLNSRGAEYFSKHIARKGLKLQYAIDYCK